MASSFNRKSFLKALSVGTFFILSSSALAVETKDIEAGPIWNNQHAQTRCPEVCKAQGYGWQGAWKTTVWGKMSVCGCVVNDSHLVGSSMERNYPGSDMERMPVGSDMERMHPGSDSERMHSEPALEGPKADDGNEVPPLPPRLEKGLQAPVPESEAQPGKPGEGDQNPGNTVEITAAYEGEIIEGTREKGYMVNITRGEGAPFKAYVHPDKLSGLPEGELLHKKVFFDNISKKPIMQNPVNNEDSQKYRVVLSVKKVE